MRVFLLFCFLFLVSLTKGWSQTFNQSFQKGNTNISSKNKSVKEQSGGVGPNNQRRDEISNSRLAGGGFNKGGKLGKEKEVSEDILEYNAGYKTTWKERKARFLDFIGLGERTPNTPEEKKEKEKEWAKDRADERGSIKYKGAWTMAPNSQRRVMPKPKYDRKNESGLWSYGKARKLDLSALKKPATDEQAPVPLENFNPTPATPPTEEPTTPQPPAQEPPKDTTGGK